ncbi:MAG: carbon-nitrogen hydrolase family protein [Acidobacteria bacterium]|nr:carbon-nitrogen hydrolase family protein [Acidobacteriota bacterium]
MLAASARAARTIPIALVQFDAQPEHVDQNLAKMEALAEQARRDGARWVIFHEGTVCDYTPRLSELAEPVPAGKCTQRMARLSKRLDCFISFGLSENDRGHYHITQVFVGPKGFLYRYRKSWLWRQDADQSYRNEWARYDTGTGPELFKIDGVMASCFICADGEAPRCIERVAGLHPQVVFYPNNRGTLPPFETFGRRAKRIGAPMLVSNRTGASWMHQCQGGCVLYAADGTVLAKANREGREEILHCTLAL